MSNSKKLWAVVPAAGAGKRMGANAPKQYLQLAGKTVIEHTLTRLIDAQVFAGIIVAISGEDEFWPQLEISKSPLILTAQGGKERADSVLSSLHSLAKVAEPDDWVLVHDAARCCLTITDIHKLIEQVSQDANGGILAVPMHDTLKSVHSGKIAQTVDRSRIWRALTPQMFRCAALREALIQALEMNNLVTDEASAMELIGETPSIVEGRTDNIKITRPEDLALANFYLEQQCYE